MNCYFRNEFFHQVNTIYLRHLYCHLKARGVRSRNTEELIIKLNHKMANYQGKWYVLMKFFHDEEHIVFNNNGKGRKRKKIFNGVNVIAALAC